MTRDEALNAITAFVENYACGSDLDGLREAIEVLKKRQRCKFRSMKNCEFCAFHSDCDEACDGVKEG